jgi:LPXTG-motif cell wall-anchored protein
MNKINRQRTTKHPGGAQRRPLASLALMLGGVALMAVAVLVPSSAGATVAGPGVTVEVDNTPYSSVSGECDEDRDGWHIIMNGITTSDGEPPTASDFGPVNLLFSDSSTAQAVFTDASSVGVAHFLNDTSNQEGPYTLTAAAMTFPNGTRITSFNKFVISHPPCGTIETTTTTVPDTTTTTVPDTTTTTSPVSTTTTVPDTTTTTSPVSTETTSTTSPVSTETTSTTSPVSTLPTTSIPPGTPMGAATVDTVVVERQVQTARTARAATGSTLPSTGMNGGPFLVTGLLLLTAGIALWVITRRKATA